VTLEFLSLPIEEQREYQIEYGTSIGLSPVIIEKDFWVCWTLSVLFRSSFADVLLLCSTGFGIGGGMRVQV
jgi:hypothetical protein